MVGLGIGTKSVIRNLAKYIIWSNWFVYISPSTVTLCTNSKLKLSPGQVTVSWDLQKLINSSHIISMRVRISNLMWQTWRFWKIINRICSNIYLNTFPCQTCIVTAQPQPQPNSTSTRVGVDKVISWTTPPHPPHPVQLLRHKLTVVVVVVNCPS